MQLLEGTPAVFSLGKLCNEHGYTYDWPSGREPRLTQNEFQTLCNSGNFVPLVGPGHSSSSTTASSSTSPPQDRRNEGATGNCSEGVAANCKEEGIPEWLEDFAENLGITEVPAPADVSHDTDLEPSGTTETLYFFYSLAKRLKLRGLQENQDFEGSLQTANLKSREVW